MPAKFSEEFVREVREFMKTRTCMDAVRYFGISYSKAYEIKTGKFWRSPSRYIKKADIEYFKHEDDWI